MNDNLVPNHERIVEWEQSLIRDYFEYRWETLMQPLCDTMHEYKKGNVAHEEMDLLLEKVHKETCEMRNLFKQRHDRLVHLIQWWDRDWFLDWIEHYEPPPGVDLLPEKPE